MIPGHAPEMLRSPLDAAAAGDASLPSWDLSDLYAGPGDSRLLADLTGSEADARALQERLMGKLAGLSGDALAAAIAEYEKIEEVLGRVMSFAQLRFSGDAQDSENGRFYQTMQERVTNISSHLVFFTLELNHVSEAALEEKLSASPALARFRPWLRDLRVWLPHQLSDEMERMLHEKEVTGRAAWNRLFDETMAT